ncbi:MAG: flagellar motor protein MotB [Candidatus Marinimicrobia bacterium]|nr:flagellar motor protein MotB [Candidatus Neomarinimicrobiota bacterium]
MAEENKRRKIKSESSGEEESWLTTYADMMTLLMTFFVLLFSMSKLDPVKLEQFGSSVGDALGGGPGGKAKTYTLSEVFREVVKVVEQEKLKDIIQVETSPRGVCIKIPSEISFQSGSADLNPNIFPILDKLDVMIRKSAFPIAIEGHTDSDPIKSPTYPSNWELSSARAAQVVRYFSDRGVPSNRFQAVGYSDTRPRSAGKTIDEANSTDEKKSQNRRVEIFFLTVG